MIISHLLNFKGYSKKFIGSITIYSDIYDKNDYKDNPIIKNLIKKKDIKIMNFLKNKYVNQNAQVKEYEEVKKMHEKLGIEFLKEPYDIIEEYINNYPNYTKNLNEILFSAFWKEYIDYIKQFLNKKFLIYKKFDINREINYWMEKIFRGDFKSNNNLNNISSIKYHFKSIINIIVPLKAFDEYIEKFDEVIENFDVIDTFFNKIENINLVIYNSKTNKKLWTKINVVNFFVI